MALIELFIAKMNKLWDLIEKLEEILPTAETKEQLINQIQNLILTYYIEEECVWNNSETDNEKCMNDTHNPPVIF